jgi:4-amino-4-deoxy-L-arabinose transferase-like glycosyltransferase
MLITILIICALVCFLLGAFGVSARVNLTDLGLAFLTLTLLLGQNLL